MMYAQVVYENESLAPPLTPKFLNPYVIRMLAAKLNADSMEHASESAGLACMHAYVSQDYEAALTPFYIRRTLLEAERRKAEALNMLRLKEIR
ncbi:MAG: hypothetical protein JSW53_02565 [Candidatus Bathyarchaeota archaeon]|nr:MAG: hypothetical protein JSW53_02565 [Candidatus Bathyarchaeota archaeon]